MTSDHRVSSSCRTSSPTTSAVRALLALVLPGLGCSDPLAGVERTYAVTCQPTGAADLPPKIKLTRMLAAADLVNPVQMVPDIAGSPRVFLVNQGGTILVADSITEGGTARPYLDLTDRVAAGGETGLLAMALDPDFARNGRLYVDYTTRKAGPLQSRVSRLRVPVPPSGLPDPKSEQVLLTVTQPYDNHNGGQIAFGPDRLLYVGFGDGGSGGDPERTGQRKDTLLGKILRLDVNTDDASYKVPADNPFYTGQARANGTLPDNSHCRVGTKPGTCGEIWALGLRNPWRFSFDTVGGTLWAGDVGQGVKEEIDIIEKGRNYGWRCREGFDPYNEEDACLALRAAGGLTDPIVDYPREDGKSVTGGVVYRGKALPGLYGAYLFADFADGNLWALLPKLQGGWARTTLLTGVGNVSAFGQDHDGEVYILDYAGKLLRLDPADPGAPAVPGWPARLSETGCYEDLPARRLVQGALRYSVNSPLWSDGAAKERAVVLPPGATLGYKDLGAWELPPGTILIKTFLLGEAPVETRFLIRDGDGVRGATYRWDETGRDAALLTAGSTVRIGEQEWTFPSRADCQACHTKAAGSVLGLTTLQLNRDHDVFGTGEVPILDALTRIGYLSGQPLPAVDLPRAPAPDDERSGIGARARAYLDSNCASCHRPGGLSNATVDLRAEIALAATGGCGTRAQHGDLGVPGALVIAPGHPEQSTLYLRMMTLERMSRMPPLASARVDPVGTELIRAWIAALPGCDG